MDRQREMRASDSDRRAVVERLSAALEEGRLNLHEYDERLVRAYESRTYGDLADLFVDLPGFDAVAVRDATVPARVAQPVATGDVTSPFLPTWIRVLWTIWLTAVSINLAIWLMVSLSGDGLAYFWPMWVAGPLGAGLIGLSIGATAVRRGRRAGQLRRDLEAAARRQAGKVGKSGKTY